MILQCWVLKCFKRKLSFPVLFLQQSCRSKTGTNHFFPYQHDRFVCFHFHRPDGWCLLTRETFGRILLLLWNTTQTAAAILFGQMYSNSPSTPFNSFIFMQEVGHKKQFSFARLRFGFSANETQSRHTPQVTRPPSSHFIWTISKFVCFLPRLLATPCDFNI